MGPNSECCGLTFFADGNQIIEEKMHVESRQHEDPFQYLHAGPKIQKSALLQSSVRYKACFLSIRREEFVMILASKCINSTIVVDA
jgi:hypothetical protein